MKKLLTLQLTYSHTFLSEENIISINKKWLSGRLLAYCFCYEHFIYLVYYPACVIKQRLSRSAIVFLFLTNVHSKMLWFSNKCKKNCNLVMFSPIWKVHSIKKTSKMNQIHLEPVYMNKFYIKYFYIIVSNYQNI